jgi:predicted AlkP superfamily pyrophosphatase or phosphodiesterase
MIIRKLQSAAVAAAAVLAMCAGAPAARAAAAAPSDHVVVLISVDGLAGYYLDDPKAEMPNIRALAKQGGRAKSMRAVAPSVTWPNHTTLVTGVSPARHGVVGNNYYDRAAGKNVTLIWDPVYDKDQVVKVPTIYDVAKEAGLSTAAVRWPASRNARTLDWTTPDVLAGDLYAKYTTPSLLAECRKEKIGIDGSRDGGKAPERIVLSGEQDREETRAFNLILREHRPNLALLHLLNVDHTEHAKGPRSDAAYAAIKEADQRVGEVWDEVKRDFPGKASIVIVSDHGFSPIEHAVLPNVLLRQAGLVDVKGVRVVGGSVHVVPQGGCAMIYIKDKDRRDEIVARVNKAFEGAKGIDRVVKPDGLAAYGIGDSGKDPSAPDMVLFAEEGWSFGDTAAGALAFVDKPERNGTHGHNPDLPDLHATFVAWGAGVKPGSSVGEIRNVDVAPTVARLLGVEMKNVEGTPVSGVLAE